MARRRTGQGHQRKQHTKVGDAGISTLGAYGHAVYVEEVLDGGAKVRVSQFNADMTGTYSEATFDAAKFIYIHF